MIPPPETQTRRALSEAADLLQPASLRLRNTTFERARASTTSGEAVRLPARVVVKPSCQTLVLHILVEVFGLVGFFGATPSTVI